MNIICALLLWSLGVTGDSDLTQPPKEFLEKVYVQYPYMQYSGKLFSFESEFTWPEGYRRLDSASLSPYQTWVSHMPLWHRQVGVYSLATGNLYKPEQISRAVHLPWRTAQFRENVIPLQMLSEFLLLHKQERQWQVIPKGGDTITYDKHLAGEVYYDSRQRLRFKDGEVRFPDSLEFNKFINLIAVNTDYLSLTANADSIAEEDLRPGDLFVGRDEYGSNGRVFVIMLVLQNDQGDRRFIAATGCPIACDFHIPLFHDDRANPWLTLDEVRALPPSQFPFKGYYRLRLP